MTLKIRTYQLGSARTRGEGLRLGAVRFLPRGVRSKDYARLDLFDVWLPTLAPSRELLATAKQQALTFERFAKRYACEMQRTEARQTIKLVAAMARRAGLAIGCYCADERCCHRSILIGLIREAARTA
jgi:uncharacterized protein YeaO (DUF488 family)